jgi:fumarylacetoacetase
MRTGDLIGTGTLSGTTDEELGCLLEATLYGKKPYHAQPESSSEDGLVRTFLQDGDEVEFRAQADDGSGLGRVGFGTCVGKILSSVNK